MSRRGGQCLLWARSRPLALTGYHSASITMCGTRRPRRRLSCSRPCSPLAYLAWDWTPRFGERAMKTAIAILMAVVLSTAAIVSTSAQVVPAPVVRPAGHPPSAGLWIGGAIGLGILSVIARANVVNVRENRELTSTEATDALLLPFGWIFSPILGGFNLSPPIPNSGTHVDFSTDRDLTGKGGRKKPGGRN